MRYAIAAVSQRRRPRGQKDDAGEESELLRVEGREMGEYRGTVRERASVVPFRHCLGKAKWAEFGCVGKDCAGHLSGVVLSVRHPADTTW